MSAIQYPGKHDVMLGRGGESNYHSGNIAFRHMVQKHKEAFRMGSRKEKNRVIEEVVQEWRNRTPPGQFVAKHRTDAGDCFWTDVGDELAKKRAAKSLAEWTPTPQRSTFPDAIETQIAEYKLPRARSKRAAPKEAHNSQVDQEMPPNNKRQYLGLPTQSLPPIFPASAAVPAAAAAAAAAASATSVVTSTSHIASLPAVPEGNQILGSLSNREYTVAIQNQFRNLTDLSILPIDKVRAQIPTAAELSASVFSDDEKDSHGKSSHGSGSSGTHRSSGDSNNAFALIGSSVNFSSNDASNSDQSLFRGV